MAAGVLVAIGFMTLAQRPEVASVHGEIVDTVLNFLLVVVGVFIVVGHFLLGLWIWRGAAQTAKPGDGQVSKGIEIRIGIAVIAVMAIVSESGVIILGMPAWEQLYGTPPANALEIEVVGKQFGWIVRYPGEDGKFGQTLPELVDDMDNPLGLDDEDPDAEDDIVLDAVMHVPLDRPVVVRLRSHDVLHSFSVAQLRVKQDLIPGLVTSVQFVATRPDTFEIACAELCGLGHYRMRGLLTAESPDAFAKWLSEQETFQ